MERKKAKPGKAISDIRTLIASMSLVAQGTITRRDKVCGKAGCRCARDPSARHGPYYDWTRREHGRYTHTALTEEQAAELATAIENHRSILALLRQWSTETAKVLGIGNMGK